MDVNNSLFQAVREGNVRLAKEIIDTYGISHSKSWVMGYVLLRISTKNKHAEITKLLLSNGAKTNNNSKRRKLNNTPLHFASIKGTKEIVEMLLEKGANINAKNEFGGTALQNAVFRNKLDIVEVLLNRGASVDDKKNDGTTCLHTAVLRKNFRAVEILLEHKANVNVVINSQKRSGQTPLHLAAVNGHEKIVELLLKNGAFVDAKSQDGLTPVYFAALQGHENVVKQLLHHRANVDAQDKLGKTILLLAVEKGSLNMVEHILKYRPDPNNKMNRSSVHLAIYGDKEKYEMIIEKFLEHGFTYDTDPKLLETAVEKGYTQIIVNFLKSSSKGFLNNVSNNSSSLIHAAVKKNQYKITEILINYGANLNAMDEYHRKPIYYAIAVGDINMVNLLLAKGASLTNCAGLLINAVKKNSKEMVHFLLKHKVNVQEIDLFGRSALHFTALNELDECWDSDLCMKLMSQFFKNHEAQVYVDKSEIAKILLAAGANVNIQSQDGKSALHCACYKGYFNLVEILFEHNAKMFPDKIGALPIHLSAYSGNVDILKMLISKGADVNAKTKEGSTALHIAIREVHIKFLEYLLNHGANIYEKEENGSTALHIAAENDCADFVELLLRNGADIDGTDGQGRTALNIATKRGNNLVVRALLEYGCDIQNQTKRNVTPFKSAMMMDASIFEDFFNHCDSDYDDDDDYYDLEDDCDSDYHDYCGSENDYDSDDDYDDDYFDYGVKNIFSDNTITEMLHHHVILMKAANLPVKENNLDSLGRSNKLSDFKTKCEQEVKKLKCKKICANTNVTFYDILSKSIDNVANYARNPKIIEVLKSDDYKKRFPTYSGLIKGKIIRGINRKDLLERGHDFFDLLSESLSIMLPYNCRENICSYLNDNDMRNLIDALNPNK